MKRSLGFTVLLLAASWVATASAQQATPPAKGTASADFANQIPAVDRANLQDYKATLESRTKQRWLHAKPPVSTPGLVKITCWVHTDGSVTGMTLEGPSGKVALDRAAWAAITGSAPYDAFPYGIAVDEVRMRFTFSYNGAATTASKGNSTTTTPTGTKANTTNPNPSSGSAPVVSRRPQ
jgi:TonB family protein